VLQANNYGQTMAVDMSILGVNDETAIVRTGWMYETDALVPRLTTIFVK
jgi:dTDP-4-dehydrorhamnose reductase